MHILIKDNNNNYTLGKGRQVLTADHEAYKSSSEKNQNLSKKGCNYSPPPTSAEGGKGQKSQARESKCHRWVTGTATEKFSVRSSNTEQLN